ncbi:MAG: SDR family NAD(P)-dependent oxidoreductase [Myxococcales bacterium]|jgi:short-subunit dehydrogenase
MANVLILGATSAIAADLARIFDERGDALYLVGRSAEKLEELLGGLSGVVGSASADFTDTDGNARVVQDAIDRLGGVDVAVIAHGLLGDQLRSEVDFAEAAAIIQTNFTSAVSLLLPIANHMEARGRGRIVVLSSVAGERGRPRNFTYGAAKGGLTIYLQGLRSRLWPKVSVHTIKLGPVHTPMTVGHPKNRLFAESDRVARDIVAAYEAGRAEAYVPWYWRPIMGAVTALPERIFQRFGFLSGR